MTFLPFVLLSFAAINTQALSLQATCSGKTYTVLDGDYCDVIEARLGVPFGTIVKLNGGVVNKHCTNLDIGQVICVGSVSSADSISTSVTTSTVSQTCAPAIVTQTVSGSKVIATVTSTVKVTQTTFTSVTKTVTTGSGTITTTLTPSIAYTTVTGPAITITGPTSFVTSTVTTTTTASGAVTTVTQAPTIYYSCRTFLGSILLVYVSSGVATGAGSVKQLKCVYGSSGSSETVCYYNLFTGVLDSTASAGACSTNAQALAS
ncbi:Chitinase 2 [Marasmius crinis-equi]|uniref:Chitinase 2 n=1 Tax=Marasmius crinis-equi TaxID=585013 RepID=A0ABR3FW81_9AGAR